MDNIIAEILTVIITIVVVSSVVAGLGIIINKGEKTHDDAAWNGGYCSCGGTWSYEQAVGHRYDTSYIYVCDDCGKRIEIYEMR